jgi:hypothetical protein
MNLCSNCGSGNGIYTWPTCKCEEYCVSCKYDLYRSQSQNHWKCWGGGWNKNNGNPIPQPLILPETSPLTPPLISPIGYKFVKYDLKSIHGNEKPWRLFKKFYLDNKKPIKLCSYGYHSSDSPYAAYTYVSEDIILKVERLGEIIPEERSGYQHKVVSRGLRPLAIAWVGDITSSWNDRVITETQFNEFIVKRLNRFTYTKGHGFYDLKRYAESLIRKPQAISSVIQELDRFTKVKRA